MQVLFIVLNDLSYLNKVLAKMLELKVRGATIIDSQGMASAIMESEGLSALLTGPFSRSLQQDQKNSKTIFTVIPEDDKAPLVIEEIKKVTLGSAKPVIGFMFTVPVSGIYPIKNKPAVK